MSARTPERRSKNSSCCWLADIFFSRRLHGFRGGALASRAYLAGGVCPPLMGRRADIKWPLHHSGCMCNDVRQMIPRLLRSPRETELRDNNAGCLLAEILFSHRNHRIHRSAPASRACHAGGACSPLVGRRADIKWPLHRSGCMCNDMRRMAPRLPRSPRKIKLGFYLAERISKIHIRSHEYVGQWTLYHGHRIQKMRNEGVSDKQPYFAY